MKRVLALLLCALLLTLSACQRQDPAPAPAAATGRYVEQALGLPAGLSDVVTVDQIEDGSIWIIGTNADRVPSVWSSDDLGETWREESYPWLAQLAAAPTAAHVVSPDEIYVLCSVIGDYTDRADFTTDSVEYFYRGDRTQFVQLDSTPLEQVEMQYNVKDIRVSAAGDLLIKSAQDITVMDGLSSRVKQVFDVDGAALFGGYITFGNVLLAAQHGSMLCYDLETGALLNTLEDGAAPPAMQSFSYASTVITAMAPDQSGDAVFYANTAGLFRQTLDGAVTERLMDGDLASLCLPTNRIRYLFVSDAGDFLAVCRDGSANRFFRYTFDATLPAQPSQVITVYSLEENRTVRQAIGQLQATDPDVKISYRIGIAAGSAVTAPDALRTLSTEMLAGRGPDVLVLDGMPIDTYIERGVLADITPLFEDALSSGAMMPIAGTFSRDGKLYAVPGRIRVPLMQNKDGATFADLTQLADWLEVQAVREVGAAPARLVERFYPYLSPGWFLPDGSLDVEQFASDLEQLGRIAAMHTPYPDEDILYREPFNLGAVSAGIRAGTYPIAFSNATSFQWPSVCQAYADAGYAGPLSLFPEGGAVMPGTILGISAAAQNRDFAEQFVRYTLSQANLASNLNDGFATHYDALRASSASPLPPGQTSESTGRFYDVKNDEWVMQTIASGWLSDAQIADFVSLFASIEAVVPGDTVVKAMILAETEPYITGERSFADTMQALTNKLDIYLNQ